MSSAFSAGGRTVSASSTGIAISHLREILDLSETLNFTETAQNLNLSQPSLSRHVSSIEGSLGLTIFKRSSNSVRLTSEGKVLVEGIATALAELDKAHLRALSVKKVSPTTIKIGGGVRTPRMRELISSTKKGLQGRDDVNIFIEFFTPHTSGDLFELAKTSPRKALDKELVDIAVGVYEGDEDEYVYVDLYDVELGLYASPDSPWVERGNVMLQDLKTQRFVFPLAFADLVTIFRDRCEQCGFTPTIEKRAVAYVGDAFSPAEQDEVFVTFKDWHRMHRYMELDDLVEIRSNDPALSVKAKLVYRKDRETDVLLCLVEQMVASASDAAKWAGR